MIYIIAEVLALLGFILYIYAVIQTNNRSLFRINLLENAINLIKNLLLGGFTAVIVQVFGTISLYLKTKNKFTGYIVYVVVISQIIVGLLVNNKGYLGLLPIIASSSYYFLITKINSNIKIKLLLASNLMIWVIYYIIIKDYVGALTNTGITLFTLLVAIRQTIKE